jgi:hypothetical protein
MNPSFDTLVEQVKSRSVEEREELRFLLERSLVSERRQAMKSNFRRSRLELKQGRLKFSSSVRELKRSLAAT